MLVEMAFFFLCLWRCENRVIKSYLKWYWVECGKASKFFCDDNQFCKRLVTENIKWLNFKQKYLELCIGVFGKLEPIHDQTVKILYPFWPKPCLSFTLEKFNYPWIFDFQCIDINSFSTWLHGDMVAVLDRDNIFLWKC